VAAVVAAILEDGHSPSIIEMRHAGCLIPGYRVPGSGHRVRRSGSDGLARRVRETLGRRPPAKRLGEGRKPTAEGRFVCYTLRSVVGLRVRLGAGRSVLGATHLTVGG
jgi:hypothetical protein